MLTCRLRQPKSLEQSTRSVPAPQAHSSSSLGISLTMRWACGSTVAVKLPLKLPSVSPVHRSTTSIVMVLVALAQAANGSVVSTAAVVLRLSKMAAVPPSARGLDQACHHLNRPNRPRQPVPAARTGGKMRAPGSNCDGEAHF